MRRAAAPWGLRKAAHTSYHGIPLQEKKYILDSIGTVAGSGSEGPKCTLKKKNVEIVAGDAQEILQAVRNLYAEKYM